MQLIAQQLVSFAVVPPVKVILTTAWHYRDT